MKNIWTTIKKPILMLAPMAGYTDSAFRIVCKRQGANLLMTELVSADAIAHFAMKSKIQNPNVRSSSKSKCQNNPTFKLMEFRKEEMPIIVQLFGKDPEKFAVAAKWIEKNLQPAGIDINMGCPARKIIGSDHGATLLRDQKRGLEIVKTVRDATSLPLSAKTRLGWECDDEILGFGPKLIAAGVDALIIHGRTYRDGFSGNARWENIYKLKSKILPAGRQGKDQKSKLRNIAIIGNGDIKKYDDIIQSMKNLDGVAIGRGAIGNPFIFNPDFEKLSEVEKLALKKKIVWEHAKLAFKLKGKKGIIELRKHLLVYFRGHPRAKVLRKKFVMVENPGEIKKILAEIV